MQTFKTNYTINDVALLALDTLEILHHMQDSMVTKTEFNQSINRLDTRIGGLETRVGTLETKVSTLETKMDQGISEFRVGFATLRADHENMQKSLDFVEKRTRQDDDALAKDVGRLDRKTKKLARVANF